MSNYIVTDTDMTSVADAIRTKGNTQAPLEFPSGFESAISVLGDATLAALIDRRIKEIEIPSGVTSIGDNAFNGCSLLNSIDIPSSVTRIGASAFRGCISLTSINIPSGVTIIGGYAFLGCRLLNSIDIPSGVTGFYIQTFYDCTSLASITCRAQTPPTLGNDVFGHVPADCAIYVPAESVDTYKAASGWSDRAAYIQAIPT